MGKRWLWITVILFWVATLVGCTGMQDKMRSMDRMRAIKQVKRGEIAGNRYINHYFKFSLDFNAKFTPRLSDHDALLTLHHTDQISEIRVFAREPGSSEPTMDELISTFGLTGGTDTGLYDLISTADIFTNGLSGQEVLVRYSLEAQPMNSLLHVLNSDSYDYIITFCTLEPLYEDIVEQIEEIFGSFTLTSADQHDGMADGAGTEGSVASEAPDAGSQSEEPNGGGADRQADTGLKPGRAETSAGVDESSAVRHVVQAGETLALIAEQYTGSYRTWQSIAEFNQIDDPALLQAGQAIFIPNHLLNGSPPPQASRPAGNTEQPVSAGISPPPEPTPPSKQEIAPPATIPVKADKTQHKKYALDADTIWQAITTVIGEQGYPVRIADDGKHLLMTGYIYENEFRFRFTVNLESIAENLTKLTVIGSMQKKSDDSWDSPADVGGKTLWAKENQLYDRIKSKLQ